MTAKLKLSLKAAGRLWVTVASLLGAEVSYTQDADRAPEPAPVAEQPDPREIDRMKDAPRAFAPGVLPAPETVVGEPWVPIGPASTTGGQVTVPPSNEIAGCIQALVVHPTNPDIIYVGSIGGGVWRTANATAASPTWTPLTDAEATLNIGAVEFDPTDATRQTLVVGTAKTSSFAARGGALIGVLRTTNGGSTWATLGTALFSNENLTSVAARGAILLAASDNASLGSGSGLFRSTNTGGTFTLVSGGSGLTAGPVSDLIADPANQTRFFAAVRTVGIFRSEDTGATWTNVTAGITGITTATTKVEMAMMNNGTTSAVYVAVLSSTALASVWRSTNLGASWTQMDTPATGGQTSLHFSIAADPANPALVYVGGQANRFRGDATLALGSQFTTIQGANAGNTTPHADPREMVIDPNGHLLEGSDGGIYRRLTPQVNGGVWVSVNGNLATFEAHDVAYDSVGHVGMIGTQDNGTHVQPSSAGTVWTWISGGDGGDVAIDDVSIPGQSLRYGSSQNLGGFYRKTYNASNTLLSTVFPALTVLAGGPAIVGQFVTPLEINRVAPTRLAIGGSNSVYESLDQGASVTALSVGVGVNRNAMTYGGRLSGVDNPDVLYFGSGVTVRVRTTAGGAVAATPTAFPGGTVQDVFLDSNDWRRAFVCDSTNVYLTPDAGTTWSSITGNLSGVGTLRALEFFRLNGTDCVAVGTDIGVYVSFVDNLGTWLKLGTGLPNVVVFDLCYNAADSVLVTGTLGRSAFRTPIRTAPLTQLTLSFSANPVTEGDAPATATVTASPVPAADLLVSLTSGDTSEATVPVSVTILSGQATATFPVTILDDALLDGTQTATIIATASGYVGASSGLAVQDNETATLTLSIPATTIEGAGTVSGTVSVSSAPASDVVVSLNSSDTTEVTVPATTTILAGQTAATFTITVINDNLIDGTQNATITAHVGNWTDGAAPIAVQDNEALTLTVTLPTQITEGGTGSGTVATTGTVLSDLSITLASSDPAHLTVPATATILAGASSASFTLTAPNNALTEGTQTVTITASAAGFTDGTRTTTVRDNDVHHFAIGAIPSPQTRGAPFSVTVTAQDFSNLTVTSYTGAPALSATGSAGTVTISPVTAGPFVSGVWTGNVTAGTFSNAVVLSVNDGAGHTGASNAFNVGTGALHHFAWAPVASPQMGFAPFSTTVTAQDAGNNTVTSFTGTAGLTGYTGSGTGATVLITEASPNGADEVEFMNVSASAVNIAGWTVHIYDDVTWPAPLAAFTIPAGTTCAAGQIFRLQEFGTAPGSFPQFFTGANISWNPLTTSFVAVLLRDASGNMVDFVCVGAATPASITSPAVIPASQWSGAAVTATTLTTQGYSRTGNADANTAANWAAATLTLGTTNAGLTVPFPGGTTPVTISPTVTTAFSSGTWTGNVTVEQLATQMRLRANDGASHLGDSNAFDVLGNSNLTVTPATGLNSSGNFGGPFAPSSVTFTLGNSGTASLTWTAAKTATWLTLSTSGGTLNPGATTSVVATISAPALVPGSYSDTLTFTNTTNGGGNTTRPVTLNVILPAPVIAAEPAFSGGTANTLVWSNVFGAAAYEIQRATALDFSDAVSSGPTSGPSHTFGSLGDGTLYLYRVRAGRDLLAGTSAAWVQTTQADFDTDVKDSVITTAAGEVILLSGGSVPIGGRITNPSFEGGSLIGWTSDGNTTGLVARSSTGTALAPMPTTGTYFASFNSLHNTVRTAGEYVRLTQNVDLTNISALLFDSVRGVPAGSTWSGNVRAEVRLDGATVWSSAVVGATLDQSIDVSSLTGIHAIELRAEVITSGTFNAQWVCFDNLRVIGSGFAANGTLTSQAIAPSVAYRWGTLTFTHDVSAAGTAVAVDVLGANGALLAASVASGTNLNTLPAVASQPALKLRANLSSTTSGNTPRLNDWTLDYQLASGFGTLSAWSTAASSTQDATGPAITVGPVVTTLAGAKGSASDPAGVTAVVFNGSSATTGNGFAQWVAPAGSLTPGVNLVPVSASDGALPPNTTTGTASVFFATMSGDADGDGLPDAWEAQHDLDLFSALGDHGALGDRDRDGIANLLELAFGLDPNRAQPTGLPLVSVETKPADSLPYLILRYRRLLAPGALVYTLEI